MWKTRAGVWMAAVLSCSGRPSAKNAMLVLPDADVELTADAAVAAGYGSAGERCMAQTLVIAVGDAAELGALGHSIGRT